MKRSTILKLKQLKVIIIAWMIMRFLISIYDHLLLQTSHSAGFSESYSFLLSAARNIGAGLLGALLGGSFLVFYINTRFQDKPYGYTIIAVTVLFLQLCTLNQLLLGSTGLCA